MIGSWSLILVCTIFIARYLKDIGPIWFRIHFALNLLAVAASLAGWITIIVDKKGYEAKAHHILGTIVILFSLAQPIIGFLANKMFDPSRTKVPIFPDHVHNW
jgi:hypothetical protein